MSTFKALLATQEDGKLHVSFQQLDRDQLPPGEVLIRVAYSGLNYKDGLAVLGRPGVMRKFPMVPGIDLAGVVEESSSPEFKPGDQVVMTGGGLSETVWGGYSELARLDATYLIPLPQGLTLKQAMGIGTAGFTAMQCVLALEKQGVVPGGRDVVVTGATGGVGSVAVAVLAKLGYRVAASTGRGAELGDYLRSLGAAEILDRATLSAPAKGLLASERWGGAVDTVGGDTLAGVLRAVVSNGSVAACGLAGGLALNTTVAPFILRGVNLLGINSVFVPKAERVEIWQRLSRDLPLPLLDSMIQEEPLDKIFELSEQILAGHIHGRTVIRICEGIIDAKMKAS
jgi:acrylyl-CoA reductase (NADPH)